MIRRLAPFLTVVVLTAGLFLVFEHKPTNVRKPIVPGPPAASSTATKPVESRPETNPAGPIAAVPYAESAPDSRTESAPASAPYKPVVVFELVREDERPIAGAGLEVTFGDHVLFARTDEQGKAELEAHPGVPAMLEASGAAFCVHEERVSLDSGTVRVVVPNGARVTGRVTVDHRPPEEPIAIGLTGDSPRCGLNPPNGSEHHSITDAAGRFEFYNLPPGWKGFVAVPVAYALSSKVTSELSDYIQGEDARVLALDSPVEGLDIGLLEHVTIKGRVMRRGSPVRGWIRATLEIGAESYVSQMMSEEDGRFRVWAGKDISGVTLEVSDALRLATQTLHLQGPFDSIRNVGDVELSPVREVRFRVRDAKGEAVAGAVGEIVDSSSMSPETDADGASAITVDEKKRVLRVGKLGFVTATVPVPDDASTPVEIVLAAGNQLIIDVRLADGTKPQPSSFVIVLSSRGPIFTGPNGMYDDLLQRTGGAQSYGQTDGENGHTAGFWVDEDAKVVVGGFLPGAEMNVVLHAALLNEPVDEKFVVMGLAEVKTVVMKPSRMPETFVGRVHAQNGDAIDGADVTMSVHGFPDTTYGTSTDPDGRFSVPGIFAHSVDLRIARDGFVPVTVHDLPLTAPGAERSFAMTPSRRVTVYLVDEKGRPFLDEAAVTAYVPGGTTDEEYAVTGQGYGSYLIENAAPKIIEIAVHVGITQVYTEHDARLAVVRMIIPTEGGAEIHWRRAAGDAVHCRIRVESVTGVLSFEDDVPEEVTDHYIEARLSPGRYFATAEAFDEESGEWVPMASSKIFEVVAHQGLLVEIAR